MMTRHDDRPLIARHRRGAPAAVLLTTLLTLLGAAPSLLAGTPTWDVYYTGDSLPDSDGWTLNNSGGCTGVASVSGGKLTLDTQSCTFPYQYSMAWDQDAQWTCEVRTRETVSRAATNTSPAAALFFRTKHDSTLHSKIRVEFRRDATIISLGQGFAHTMLADNSKLRTYRFTLNQQRFDGYYELSTDRWVHFFSEDVELSSDTLTVEDIQFGKVSGGSGTGGKAQWDYVAFNDEVNAPEMTVGIPAMSSFGVAALAALLLGAGATVLRRSRAVAA